MNRKNFFLVLAVGILFSLTGCGERPDMSSPEVVEQFLEISYEVDFQYIGEADIDMGEWATELEKENASAFLFEDENGVRFITVSYYARQMVGNCQAIKENYRSEYARALEQEYRKIAETHGMDLTLEGEEYDTAYRISISEKSQIPDALRIAEEVLSYEYPIYKEPDIRIGFHHLLWYSANPNVKIEWPFRKQSEAVGRYFFLSKKTYEMPDFQEELEKIEGKWDEVGKEY